MDPTKYHRNRKMRNWQWFREWIEDPNHRCLPLPLPPSSLLPDYTRSTKAGRTYFLRDVRRWAKQLFTPNLPFEIFHSKVGLGLKKKNASSSDLTSSLKGERVLLTKYEGERLKRKCYPSLVSAGGKIYGLIGVVSLLNHACEAPLVIEEDGCSVRFRRNGQQTVDEGEEITMQYGGDVNEWPWSCVCPECQEAEKEKVSVKPFDGQWNLQKSKISFNTLLQKRELRSCPGVRSKGMMITTYVSRSVHQGSPARTDVAPSSRLRYNYNKFHKLYSDSGAHYVPGCILTQSHHSRVSCHVACTVHISAMEIPETVVLQWDTYLSAEEESNFGTNLVFWFNIRKCSSVLDKSHTQSKTKRETKSSLSASAQASFSGWGYSGSASVSYSGQQSDSAEKQKEFESKTSKSSVLASGGAPGSYGPDQDSNGPSTYSKWAENLDLLPVPLDYDAGVIGDLLPIRASGLLLRRQWFLAVNRLAQQETEDPNMSTEYRIRVQMKNDDGSSFYIGRIFGPFSFMLKGTNSKENNNWRPLGDPLDESTLFYGPGDTITFSFKDKFLGSITEVYLRDLREEVDGTTVGDIPSGIPLASIHVIDVTNGGDYNFGYDKLYTDLDHWNCTLEKCNWNPIATQPKDVVKVIVTWQNPDKFGGVRYAQLQINGDGSQFRVYWFNGGGIGNLIDVTVSAAFPYPLDPTAFYSSNGCYGRPVTGFSSGLCSQGIWDYSTPINLTNNVFLDYDTIKTFMVNPITSHPDADDNEILIAVNPSNMSHGRIFVTSQGGKGYIVQGNMLQIVLLMYTPVSDMIQIPVIINSDPSMLEQIKISARPAYSNVICEKLSWTASHQQGNIIVTITSDPISPCIIPATIISGMQITSYDDQGNGVIYTSTSVNMLVDETWLPKAVNACGPYSHTVKTLNDLWSASKTPLLDFYTTWYGSSTTFATVDRSQAQLINASCTNLKVPLNNTDQVVPIRGDRHSMYMLDLYNEFPLSRKIHLELAWLSFANIVADVYEITGLDIWVMNVMFMGLFPTTMPLIVYINWTDWKGNGQNTKGTTQSVKSSLTFTEYAPKAPLSVVASLKNPEYRHQYLPTHALPASCGIYEPLRGADRTQSTTSQVVFQAFNYSSLLDQDSFVTISPVTLVYHKFLVLEMATLMLQLTCVWHDPDREGFHTCNDIEYLCCPQSWKPSQLFGLLLPLTVDTIALCTYTKHEGETSPEVFQRVLEIHFPSNGLQIFRVDHLTQVPSRAIRKSSEEHTFLFYDQYNNDRNKVRLTQEQLAPPPHTMSLLVLQNVAHDGTHPGQLDITGTACCSLLHIERIVRSTFSTSAPLARSEVAGGATGIPVTLALQRSFRSVVKSDRRKFLCLLQSVRWFNSYDSKGGVSSLCRVESDEMLMSIQCNQRERRSRMVCQLSCPPACLPWLSDSVFASDPKEEILCTFNKLVQPLRQFRFSSLVSTSSSETWFHSSDPVQSPLFQVMTSDLVNSPLESCPHIPLKI
ncbi:hypothetical protein PROFUN_05289 [Planoprotostelium fungivorum]|uniref:MACPF domain-containing protein n=1 Tax=Planoprotostelium fungivorum TaxID=1890364 RepID=A0A2P6NRC8_9EUKA|nr:hypothetical protein PROFUN_05289 [Planoprotostelium fungivorum]